MDVVYVLRNWGGNDRYKIGTTSDFAKRFSREVEEARIVALFQTDKPYEHEAVVHRVFSARRDGQSEVFLLQPKDVELLVVLGKSENPWPILEEMASRAKSPSLLRCGKCKHEWQSRKPNPKECPECKSRKWSEHSTATGAVRGDKGHAVENSVGDSNLDYSFSQE